jgi:adenylate cyclase
MALGIGALEPVRDSRLFTVSRERADEPLGYLVVVEPGGQERRVPIFDQLVVGRECAGVSEDRRLVISDLEISRSHLEIRLDAATDQAFVIDTSTNGTLLNGMRLERAVPMPISPDDQIRLGDIKMTFRSNRFQAKGQINPALTRARIGEAAMVMVVGDITNYSTISQVTDNKVIATSLNHLWQELGHILRAHRGTLNHYAGDALYAVWDLQMLPSANELAIDFALAANQRVEELGPQLPLRGPDGSPIHMGWGVVQGMAALAAMTRSVEAVIGDATNVAFRLSGLAGRLGRHAVMVTSAVHVAAEGKFVWGDPEQVELKGRSGQEIVYPVIAHAKSDPQSTMPKTKTMWTSDGPR